MQRLKCLREEQVPYEQEHERKVASPHLNEMPIRYNRNKRQEGDLTAQQTHPDHISRDKRGNGMGGVMSVRSGGVRRNGSRDRLPVETVRRDCPGNTLSMHNARSYLSAVSGNRKSSSST